MNGTFPFIHKRSDVVAHADVPKELKTLEWVTLPDGRVGVVHHVKRDGTLGVRPVNRESGQYYLNTSLHWDVEDRKRIPEEIAISRDEVSAAESRDIPRFVHADKY